MVKKIRRRITRREKKAIRFYEENVVKVLSLRNGDQVLFPDTSRITKICNTFHAWPESGTSMASLVMGYMKSKLPASQPKPEPTEPEHVPERTDESGKFPIYSYSRLAAEDVEDGEGAEESESGEEVSESPEPNEDIECWTPLLDTVKALHLCNTFMVWELNSGKLVLDDDGSNSAVHVFNDLNLALNVMRGKTRRRGLNAREGYVGCVRHSGDWETRVASLLG